jgi:predicted RNA methylase
MSYYNKNYYPTPQPVIDIVLEGLDLKGKSILDPSAGMGAILDAVKYRCKKTYAIEIENDFQTILKEKSNHQEAASFKTHTPKT